MSETEKTDRKVVISYLQNILQFSWGIFFLVFPLFFFTFTTDTFVLPKEILLAFFTLISLLILGIRTLVEKKVRLRQTFLDLPVFVFIFSLLLSVLFAVNRFDSLIAYASFLFLGLAYFVITNSIRSEENIFFFIASLVVSGCAAGLLTIFSYYKTFLLPFTFTQVQWFTPFGSLLDQTVYLAGILPITLFFAYPIVKGKTNGKTLGFSLASLILIASIGISIYELLTIQKPLILPFGTGFQIAFASISQDAPRIAQGFFFGSGIGTFFTDFTRFKQVSFNLDQNLWFVNFFQSSSFVLELLATTGVVGLLSFFFILGKAFSKPAKKLGNPLFFSFCILSVLAFIFPFSFSTIALFFFVLILFTAVEGLKRPEKSFDLEYSLIALKKSLFNRDHEEKQLVDSQAMPIAFLVVMLLVTGSVGYYASRYVISDILFNQSLAAAANNNGSQTYEKQVAAISMFPYRDSFYRLFSQTNISLANSLLTLNSSKGTTPSSQVQNTSLNLIQQSITTARTATTLSPETVLNWQNLSSVYRSLIGFGQNADTFAIASVQQAEALDPTNPQEYLNLGGIYYQLAQYDNAIRQFQIAINIKSDFPNAYYNLGHAYEAKGDLSDAIAQYQIVKQMVINDKANSDKISSEIDAIQKKIGDQATQKPVKQVPPSNSKEPLSTNQPSQILASPIPTKIPVK